MKIYKIKSGILLESEGNFYLENSDWDEFINAEDLLGKIKDSISNKTPIENGVELIEKELLPPIKSQEIWASGVTYFNSKLARQEESKDAGGGDFYAKVYVADRPELFFKSTAHRAVGSGGKVRIRKDSTWDVPEPELTLFINSQGKISGYTVGNDMSSRSIEGENPLYLPQAKTYDASASIGPCIYVSEKPLEKETEISLVINRNGETVFEGKTEIGQIKRELNELAAWLFRETSFPAGCFLMTGTGIIPSNDFTLQSGDEIRITIDTIGTLVNFVE
ncbi:MAG TPA: fumarylacetoacetate hydrolase family protein [Pyrinomonadaceae bacterium]|nr:fumarylacetoacetate hydrolase family protein [Pyrinomonadaceae bacterium]